MRNYLLSAELLRSGILQFHYECTNVCVYGLDREVATVTLTQVVSAERKEGCTTQGFSTVFPQQLQTLKI